MAFRFRFGLCLLLGTACVNRSELTTFIALPGITLTPTSGLITSETGTTSTFTVVLNAAPTADVTIALTSTNAAEDTVSPAALTFTAANWSSPQTVTVQGVDNHAYTGSGTATIVTAAVVSADKHYNGINPPDVPVTNMYDQPIPAVGPLYTNAALWSTYVKNDGATVYTATNTPCTTAEPGGYSGCLHGGEMRLLAMPNWTSCAGLTASDAAGDFVWTCDTSLGYVRWISTALASGKTLTSLLNFSTNAWLTNTVTVRNSGTPLFTTAAVAWWGNPIAPVTGAQTLGTANTVYTVNANVDFGGIPTGLSINANNVSLAINPNNAVTDANILVAATNVNYLWIEGNFDGSLGTNTGLALSGAAQSVINNSLFANCSSGNNATGVTLSSSNKNKLSTVSVANSGSANGMGVLLSDSNYNTIAALSIGNSAGNGLDLEASSNNNVTTYTANQITNDSLHMDNGSNYNTFSVLTGSYVGRGVYANNSGHNVFENLHYGAVVNETLILETESYDLFENVTSFSTGLGVNLGGSTNHMYLHNIIIEGTVTVWTFMLFFVNDNVLANIVSLNTGGSTGESYYDPIAIHGGNNNLVLNAVAANSQTAFDLDGLNNTLINLAAANSETAIYVASTATGNRFEGSLLLGGNPNTCFAPGQPGTGLEAAGGGSSGAYSATCSIDSSLSTATLTQNVDLSTSFVGRVTTDDAANTSDVNGAATFSSTSMDWLNFSRPNRGWGIDANTMLSVGTRNPCNAGHTSCRIYDVNLLATDTILRGVLPMPTTGNETSTHTWSDGTTSTFLLNAVEVEGDGIGNDNLLCETGETCAYTPNIGVYQGHGAIATAGTLGSSGTVQNVTLMQYSTNGY